LQYIENELKNKN